MSRGSDRYDAIIIGGGHNGLVAAGYLARAGRRVIVLERRHVVGGACVTEEIVPGYKFSTTSYMCTLLRPQIIRDLELAKHGFELLPCPISFTPFTDGSHLLTGVGASEDAKSIARFSTHDAETFPRFSSAMERVAAVLRPTLDEPPPDFSSLGVSGFIDLLKTGGRFRKLSRADQALLVKVFTMSFGELVDEWFESPQIKASLAPAGTIGIWGSPRTPGTAFLVLHYHMGGATDEPGLWGFVRGGMGGLTQAMAASARSHGAEIRVSSPVEQILVRDGAAQGVVLQGGEEILGRIILSNADPKRTFLGMIDRGALPPEFALGIENLRCRGNSGKVNLALSELPDFTALPGAGHHLQGTIQITGDHPDYLEAAFDDCKSGRPSRKPFLDVCIPSILDDTLCPRGHHLMSISIKYIPYHLEEGDWSSRREELGDLAIDTLAAYAPNLRRAVLHRHVLTPLDFEQEYSLTGGNICHGDMAIDQMFAMRPLLGWARYRTPIRNLFLCGSGAHPGGGVMGAPGRNAAREALKDL